VFEALRKRVFQGERWNSRSDQKQLLRNAKVIFDVGAHVGESAEIYQELYPGAQIWAFEPAPENFDRLQRRFANSNKVHPVNLGLGDKQGEQPFFLARGSQVNSMLVRKGRVSQTIQIRTDTVDGFCAANSIPQVDILKVDIEGMEGRLFAGAAEMFRKKAVRLVFTEVYFYPVYENMPLFWDLHKQLESSGFRLYGLYSLARSAGGNLEFGNALYELAH
jgi:FkbM family methyltransferase